jgi:hypothetical protein
VPDGALPVLVVLTASEKIMTKRLRFLCLLLVAGALGVLVFVFHPQAEEVEHTEPPPVSESDLQMYIKVYIAMQDDHDLTIDEAIKPYNMALDDFRQIERHIQTESRLVDRVRQALLEHVQEHSVFAQSLTPAAGPTPAAHRTRKPKHSHSGKGSHP